MELQKCEEFLGLSYGCGDAHWKPAAVTQRPRCNMRTKGLIRFSATSNVAPKLLWGRYLGGDIRNKQHCGIEAKAETTALSVLGVFRAEIP